MRLARVVPLLAFMGVADARASSATPDPWFGPDKALHFGATFGLSVGGYAAGSLLSEEPRARLAIGGGLALGAGIAKELWDLSGRGDASWKDLTWDAIGTATGLLVSWVVDRYLLEPMRRPDALRTSESRWIGIVRAL